MSEDNLVHEWLEKHLDLATGEWDDSDVAGASIYDAQSFAFPGRCISLTLKGHREAASRGVVWASAKKAVGLILSSLLHFAFRAIGEDATSVAP